MMRSLPSVKFLDMTGRRPFRALAALCTASLSAFASGCDETGPRVYTAQRYSVEASCLETYAPIGLVDSQALGSECALVCLGLGEDVYVSSVCPPYPAEASVELEDAEGCAVALAAPACDDLAETPDAAAP